MMNQIKNECVVLNRKNKEKN